MATKKQQIQRIYNDIEYAAKESYKAKNGLQIARGFKETAVFRRIQRAKKRDLNNYKELTEKEFSRRIGALRRKEKEYYDRIPTEQYDITTPVSGEVFYKVLSYGGGVGKEVQKAFNLFKGRKQNVTLKLQYQPNYDACDGRLVDFKGPIKDKVWADLSLRDLYDWCMNAEDQSGAYPLIDMTVGELKKKSGEVMEIKILVQAYVIPTSGQDCEPIFRKKNS